MDPKINTILQLIPLKWKPRGNRLKEPNHAPIFIVFMDQIMIPDLINKLEIYGPKINTIRLSD